MLEAAIFCLALNIYHEARGESLEGQRMVAYVTMNRAEWNKKKVCTEVFRERQFSWANEKVQVTKGGYSLCVTTKPRNKTAWAKAQRIAKQVIRAGRLKPHLDPSKGAKFYHATYIKAPYWTSKMEVVAVVGRHVFYRQS